MEWMGLNEIREQFLRFFESKEHYRMPSFPLVPQEDASLLLINSGMAPLKKYFLGLETPPSKRATTCQKCIRTPDIERVGKTSRHGTFFEMLGNFSFGDYFKEDATKWAWEFLTETMKIPEDKLYVSIFEDDDEAFDIWTKRRGLDPARITRLGREDNFWEIGTGPCGPCSEIYFDRGPEHGCGSPDCAVGCDCDRYVEIWNLVFTQFNSDGEGHYTPLDHPNIDTGMGLERLACVMQGVDNLFEVDTMQNIMGEIAAIAGVKYKAGDEKTDVALRVITDHIRSTVFLVGDGVVPQNEGRGYVLRRLLRRAARFGRLLGIDKPFLHQVALRVMEENKTSYPALLENADYIREVIRAEEERFLKTIVQGMEMLQSIMDRIDTIQLEKNRRITGEDAFKLYDTFGFPLDLTRDIAEDHGIAVDEDGFVAMMQRQRERARKAREALGDVSWEEDSLAGEEFQETFIGYDAMDTKTKVLYILRGGEQVGAAKQGEQVALLLEDTPFYAESGGQVGDTGTITAGDNVFHVNDCKKSPTGHILHLGEVASGDFKPGIAVNAVVDRQRRRAIMRNHTAAHLLQAALREVLGTHVHQAGQLVDEKMCRFDFTHFSATTPEQLCEVENKVNALILEAEAVSVREMPMDQAKERGALALFGDKYSDVVRVCEVGDGQSVELCGGTHVGNTAELGLFKILRESSVAAGVRRIEAVTGAGVLGLVDDLKATLDRACEPLKLGSPAELPDKVAALSAQNRQLQKQVEEQNQKLAQAKIGSLTDNMPQIGPVRLLTFTLGADGDIDALKAVADDLKAQHADLVGIAAATGKGKVSLLAFAGKEAVKAGIHAGKLVQAVAKLAGGSGGGRPDNAMGGLPAPDKLGEAMDGAEAAVREQLGL